MREKQMRKITAFWKQERRYLLGGIVLGMILFLCWGFISERIRQETVHTLSSKVVRFHVLANSNSQEDQALKLKVRDRILDYLAQQMQDVSSKEETIAFLTEHQQEICLLAQEEILEEGYQYSVHTSLAWEDFPEKTYGDYTFPAGFYDALRIEIGEAVGENWWCVLYPQMCLTDMVYEEDTTDALLQEVLTPREYALVTEDKPQEKPQITFALKEWLAS